MFQNQYCDEVVDEQSRFSEIESVRVARRLCMMLSALQDQFS